MVKLATNSCHNNLKSLRGLLRECQSCQQAMDDAGEGWHQDIALRKHPSAGWHFSCLQYKDNYWAKLALNCHLTKSFSEWRTAVG